MKYGADELMNRKLVNKEMSFREVQSAVSDKFKTIPGLRDKFDVSKQQNIRPTNKYQIPNFTALSNWYYHATKGNQKPTMVGNLATSGAVDVALSQ